MRFMDYLMMKNFNGGNHKLEENKIDENIIEEKTNITENNKNIEEENIIEKKIVIEEEYKIEECKIKDCKNEECKNEVHIIEENNSKEGSILEEFIMKINIEKINKIEDIKIEDNKIEDSKIEEIKIEDNKIEEKNIESENAKNKNSKLNFIIERELLILNKNSSKNLLNLLKNSENLPQSFFNFMDKSFLNEITLIGENFFMEDDYFIHKINELKNDSHKNNKEEEDGLKNQYVDQIEFLESYSVLKCEKNFFEYYPDINDEILLSILQFYFLSTVESKYIINIITNICENPRNFFKIFCLCWTNLENPINYFKKNNINKIQLIFDKENLIFIDEKYHQKEFFEDCKGKFGFIHLNQYKNLFAEIIVKNSLNLIKILLKMKSYCLVWLWENPNKKVIIIYFLILK